MRARRRSYLARLAPLALAGGMLFQTTSCALQDANGDPTLAGELVYNIGSIFITDWVYNVFNVQASPF